jgi:hypothetical protein
MKLQLGESYHGFRLVESSIVNEINSIARIFYHEKSGARLLHLENDDDNKVFSITFRTPPTDSTGVPHIVEHSVLCGSRKFPLKEPFVELVKGSLNTYLNAMTFPDKTMYPVASRNDKDFRNLMNVYLDAVFYPRMVNSPEILMQEGWHYELEDQASEITYKGVVYNEMKGVFSAPDAILERKTLEFLFPDTTYGVESGGDPEYIPDLTQEQFAAFHRRYYHPANSYIFLYGDLQILDNLKFLDEAYLQEYDKRPAGSEIAVQPPFAKPVKQVIEYAISPTEKVEDKTFLSMNVVVGQVTQPENYLGFQILEHLLLETPAAPLKKALLAAGIGKDVFGSFDKSLLQPVFTIGVSGANQGQQKKFQETVEQTLRKLVKDGIDKKVIEASVNLYEFALREANYGQRPKGLVYNIKCMDSWLYDENPLVHLRYEATLEKIKTAFTTSYFEKLIKEYLLDNPHQVLVTLKPRPGLAEEKSSQIQQKLAAYKAKLSPMEINTLVEETRKLKAMQAASDSAEALTTIPLLDIKDIEPQAEYLSVVEKEENGSKVLFHPYFTNKIAYLTLYFNTQSVPQQLLPYVYLLAEILGKVDTAQYDYATLSNEVNINTGGISYEVAVYAAKEDDTVYYPKFKVKTKALIAKLPQMFDLLSQIVGHSQFSKASRLEEIIKEIKSQLSLIILRNGQQIAASRVLSYFSPTAHYTEKGLLSFYEFVVVLEKDFAGKAAEISRNLQAVAGLIFNKENVMSSITLEREHYSQFQKQFVAFLACLEQRQSAPQSYQFNLVPRNEGLMTSSKVQYVAKGANFRKLGYDYHGSLKVLETILRYDYLWTRVRVQGGAYGGFAQFERSGNMVLGSYRDPNLQETLTVYDETALYLRKFQVTDREMTKYIIGTISQLDAPLSPQKKGEKADTYYIRNISQAEIQAERDEILATGQASIRNLATMMETAMQQNYHCVLGNEQKIRENKATFNELVQVFE